MTISELIKEIRFRLNYSVSELALAIDVDSRTVYRWEQGKVIPKSTVIIKLLMLCKEKGVNINDIDFNL